MGWKLLCTATNWNPDTLKADLKKNTENATSNYSHAFLAISSKKKFLPSEKDVNLVEFSGQSCLYGKNNERVVNSDYGYFRANDALAVVVDEGEQELQESFIKEQSKTFMALISERQDGKRGYQYDCLGYCVFLVTKLAGRESVAGKVWQDKK